MAQSLSNNPHVAWFNRRYDELYDRMGESQDPRVMRQFWTEFLVLAQEFWERVFR